MFERTGKNIRGECARGEKRKRESESDPPSTSWVLPAAGRKPKLAANIDHLVLTMEFWLLGWCRYDGDFLKVSRTACKD
jgi:hypothetical protein